MFIDANTLPPDTVIETEVCVVGTGPAGITLAREFAEQDFRVCVLEGGKVDYDEEIQALHQGELVANCRYPELADSRRRQVGGTAHMWEVVVDRKIDASSRRLGARLLPLEEVDFEQRDSVPYSGWPFGKAELDPFYQRALSVCQLGPLEIEHWETEQVRRLPFAGDRVKTISVQHSSSALFTEEYREQINQASNITLYTNANVLEVETDATASTAQRLRVASLDGKEFVVTAKIFILATGGIENARLLLQSNQVQPEGLGNQHDRVGRFFMDHPTVFAGLFIPRDRKLFNSTALYDLRRVNDIAMMGRLVPTSEAVRREQLLNAFAFLLPKPKGHWSKASKSLKTLITSLRRGKLPKEALQHLGNVLTGLDDIIAQTYRQFMKVPDRGYGGWSGLSNKEKLFALFAVYLTVEQAPHPDNRVTLSEQRDRFGRRKAKLSWRWGHDIDIQSIKGLQKLLAEEVKRSGLGEFQIYLENGEPLLVDSSAHHHIGTTRMHHDPTQGVVDANCKVHGVSNLYMAGCSVFPTGGYANPTFTVVAMAIRLADHVKQVMATAPLQVGR